MQEAKKAFERFEAKGAGWMPIILLSGLGICGTVLALNTVRSIASGQLAEIRSVFYQAGRSYAQASPIHESLTPVESEQRPKWLVDYLQKLQTKLPDWSLAGTLRDEQQAPESDPQSQPFFVLWLDADQTSVLSVLVGPPGLDPEATDAPDEHTLWTTLVSVKKESNEIAATTFSSRELETPDWLNEVAREESDPLINLIKQHLESIQDFELARLKPVEAEGVYRRVSAERAIWLVSRGGYSMEAIDQELFQEDEGLARMAQMPFLLGLRGSWSDQLDELVLRQFSLQAGLEAPISTQDHIVVHRLSSPLRIESQLAGKGTFVSIDQLMNVSFQDSSAIDESIVDTIEKAKTSGRLNLVSEMTEPFAAAIYEIKKQ